MTVIIPEAQTVKDKKYDNVRQKVNSFFDFVLFRYYQDHPASWDVFVDLLRTCRTDSEKSELYCKEARTVWPKVSSTVLDHILPNMSGDIIKLINGDSDVTEDMLAGRLIPETASKFSEMIYVLTIFLDGKEINDLLTNLINAFENIGSFCDVLKERNLHTAFQKDYDIFSRSWDISTELRNILSFSRMSKESAQAKKQMFIEAAKVLGYPASDAELDAFIDQILSPAKASDEHVRGKGYGKDKGVRNFIANNVIDSPRFKYLARYGNINRISRLAKSRPLVMFVLNDIPDAQIVRYYNSAFLSSDEYHDRMRSALAEKILQFSFKDLEDVRNNDRVMNQYEQEEKRRKQSLVRLYLTILYLAVKNLVYINSRYFLAFHCVERDRLLYNEKKWTDVVNDPKQSIREPGTYGLEVFAKEFLQDHPKRPRVNAYLDQNFANSDPWAVRIFRNKVEHLDAVINVSSYIDDVKHFHSWFELYHYVMQRSMIDQFRFESQRDSTINPGEKQISVEKLNPKMVQYAKAVINHGTYCKDAVKALCVPFAYQLVRYKNLTIDGLFDKNHPGDKKEAKTLALDDDV